jgi:hypothetical protein
MTRIALLESAHESDEDGVPVYDIFTVLHLIQDKHKVDFWDFKDSSNDYERWCVAKGHPFDPSGGPLFSHYMSACSTKAWPSAPYCPFIDVVLDQFSDTQGMRYHEKTEELVSAWLIEASRKLDHAEFGCDSWRVSCANIIASEIGDEIRCCWVDG